MSVKNYTSPDLDRIESEHLKYLPPVLINTLTRLLTLYLSECKVSKQCKTSKIVLLYKKGDPQDIGNYHANLLTVCHLQILHKSSPKRDSKSLG
ncbi:hypothetical protein RB195_022508 [Necator americanus]|uniref:MRG domain-containing protein n=1 Tax=Necator americanus TaxID=51031 RepID=A0ABR1EG80_NECAM